LRVGKNLVRPKLSWKRNIKTGLKKLGKMS